MTRTLTAVFVLVFATLSARAQEARFFIERIEVRNAHRVSSDLVISESLLREGTEYSEADLRAASLRLSRLPFLLSADFALEKGSDRGRHVLVITIAETKPFFFLIDVRPVVDDEARQALVDYAGSFDAETNEAALGFRTFVGRRGIAHLGVTSRRDRQMFTTDYSAAAIGYTQYDLFGTRAFATLNLRMPFNAASGGALSPQLVIGIPLNANQTLTFDYEETRFEREQTHVDGIAITRQDAERLVSATWTYNTTNQPFVPTRGTILRVMPLWAARDRAGYRFFTVPRDPVFRPEAFAQHVNGYGIDVLGAHYWELSDRHAVYAGLQTGWASVRDRANQTLLPLEVNSTPAYVIVGGGYSFNLWHGRERNGDSRIETGLHYIARERGFDRLAFRDFDNVEGFEISANWARRSSWGTLRLGLSTTWQR
ncbi:MAG TPA: hypothetical protein VJZ00_14825 [Thermoanaerobaculia bacterium]|nr:hypothetical protein [Thermoanaerobaculia bacterium]